MKKINGKGSGLTNNGMMNPGTGPDQDGFNHPSHVTTFQSDNDHTTPQVGRENVKNVDPRGKGTGSCVGDNDMAY